MDYPNNREIYTQDNISVGSKRTNQLFISHVLFVKWHPGNGTEKCVQTFSSKRIGDMHDGVIYYEDQTALSCFYWQANLNNCFFFSRREEKSE